MKRGGLVDLDTSCNVMINWATTHLDNPNVGATTLAVRWALNGQRLFESRNRRFAIDDSSYRIFNHGSEFSSTINSVTAVECYTVCFQPEMAASAVAGLVTPDEKLLDDPTTTAQPTWQFMEKTNPHDDVVSPLLQRLETFKDSEVATHGWFEEQFRLLLLALLEIDSQVAAEIDRVPAARAATRDELYRRIQGARDFMEAGLSGPLTIQEIASAAAFSPFHFLRTFKQVFGETPHQYLTRRRVEAAKALLKNTDISVTNVCLAIGFESLGSFSWMFRRHVGVSPEGYRQRVRKEERMPSMAVINAGQATSNRVA
jgi:AraC family transcriptional regulator